MKKKELISMKKSSVKVRSKEENDLWQQKEKPRAYMY